MNHYRSKPQFRMEFDELIVDNFAGGGGASTGIESAIGRSVDIAINHDADAIAMHTVNHPTTKHYCEDVFAVDPREAAQGRPVGLVWFSPDCKHFSKAKGGKPVEKKIRGLAWVALRWAVSVRPRVIFLENVEEFEQWGPVKDGKPIDERKGETFKMFKARFERLGYKVDHRCLRASDYGTPTIRKRFFLIARCDGQPIVWPKPTHGDPRKPGFRKSGLKPWRTAASIIDWSLPCPSIFGRAKPLAENTQRRILRGIDKYVINNPRPFVVRLGHTGHGKDGKQYSVDEPLTTITSKAEHCLVTPIIATNTTGHPGAAVDEPVRTITTGNHHMLVAPVLVGCGGRAGQTEPRAGDMPAATITAKADTCLAAVHLTKFQQNSIGQSADAPVDTIMAGATRFGLCAAFLAKHFGGNYNGAGAELAQPLPTITGKDHNALVTSHMIKLRGENVGHGTDEPLHTISAQGTHLGEVRAFLIKFYSEGGQWAGLDEPMHTIPTKDRIGLVTIAGEEYQIVDIGMRMLEPHELFAAQGFPRDYVINVDAKGDQMPKYKQVARCGNSVCPPLAEALVRANYVERREAVAA
jgi:DNA (cytosine-5)-methyltransferase 1